MISFKNFLNESQWMYHGTTYPKELTHIQRNEKGLKFDTSIGAHFSADPEVANKFSKGIHKSYVDNKGAVYKTKRPSRSELETVPQKKGHDDQDSVASHVLSSVFSHPDNKDLFIKWHRNKFASSQEQASNVHEKLSNKQNIPVNKKEYGYDKSNKNTFRSYVDHHGAYSSKDIHKEIVNKFIDHMKSKGKKGLVYRNTNPTETEEVDSRKSYIIFEPEKLKVEKHD
ncbi:MAG: hypothetical protein NTZ20_05020 [Candidatus Levybacteria bacterium]|nr:hypothetical protein [Candidatus Levybacteria bacterium]